ncbi:beta-ketoacyl-ACP reductase [Buchnera aphidicola (Aphis fabae)]|uniref:3-oxoacyl-[acyl-carrier-protein] reductase FabG n=1 Tax=Buchnera aphidicola (Aphis fabae) TaxID=571430 RepID=A0A5J6ZAV3_9GAMM|nr:beta-ketoacyl-ACP reductase [Buchnera aphidicola]QFQ32522.1 beta-ketoacyl-ACP reductase [Buchnera aphidicola (Aphis fabae)]
MKITTKTALVTGANKGIGKAIAIKLLEQGIRVIGTSTNKYGVQTINKYLKKNGFGFILDLKDTNSITEKIKEIYKHKYSIDILVNNAGVKLDKLLVHMNNTEWEDIIKINLTSIFYTSKAVIRSMIKKKEGRIITINSIIGYTGNKGQINYSTAKSGLIGFHKSLALEVASKGITVNMVAPGLIQTDFIKNLNIFQYKKYLSNIPMKRLGKAEEIADAVIFLSSKKASYITGQTLHINGGMYM